MLMRGMGLSAVALLMAACAGSAPAPRSADAACPADWRAFGEAQGERGHRAAVVEQTLGECPVAEPSVAREAFLAGHAEGIARHCTAARQYARGREGLPWRNVCPSEEAQSLRAAHADGQQIREQRRQLDEQRERLRHLEQYARVGSAQPRDRERFGDPPIAEREGLREAERALHRRDLQLSRRYGAEPLAD